MTKIALIARSEYLRRVRSRWFLATTLLAPLFAVAAMVIPVVVLAGADEARPARVAVLDETGRLLAPLAERLGSGTEVVAAAVPLDSLRARILARRLDGALVLPAGVLDGSAEAAYYAGGGLSEQAALRDAVAEVVRAARVRDAGASEAVVAVFEAPVAVRMVTVSASGDASGGAIAQFMLANVLSLLLYIAILIYGAVVMRGVIEEKANRIVEVIASSARPFELMMGKVLGIGAVGLTQLAGWGLLMVGMSVAAGPLLLLVLGSPDPAALAAGAEALPFDPAALPALVTPGLMVAFVLFFLGGYLLYAGLFAAVGSAVDQESDAQTLQVPIIVPVMIPLFFLAFVADQPGAPLSVFLSLFPLSSPVLMIVRMTVSSVPAWQVALSLALLAGAFVVVIALAARIYRVGILMTGKKATLRDLWRWLRTG
jgi:ABC-2 type transport system permease protein